MKIKHSESKEIQETTVVPFIAEDAHTERRPSLKKKFTRVNWQLDDDSPDFDPRHGKLTHRLSVRVPTISVGELKKMTTYRSKKDLSRRHQQLPAFKKIVVQSPTNGFTLKL